MAGEHGPDRRRSKKLLTPHPTFVQDHSSEEGEVVGRGEETGVSRDPAEECGILILDLASQDVAVSKNRRRDARAKVGGRPKLSVAHPKRTVKAIRDEVIHR
jgi:hypothetical protein